jgi:hypothetical protein
VPQFEKVFQTEAGVSWGAPPDLAPLAGRLLPADRPFRQGTYRGVFDYSDRLNCVASVNRYAVPIGVLYAKKMMSKKRFIRNFSCCDSPTD